MQHMHRRPNATLPNRYKKLASNIARKETPAEARKASTGECVIPYWNGC